MMQVVYRIYIHGHEFSVYGYGLMLVVGFLACVALGKRLARHSRLNPEFFVNATLLAMITGIIGARLCHVLENIHEYTRSDISLWQNLRNIGDIRGGGLTFYGGFLLAVPCCIAYSRFKRIPIRLCADITAPIVMLGLGLGRIGCFLNGCCYGQICSPAVGVQFPYYSNAYIDQFDHNQITPPHILTRYAFATTSLVPTDSPEFRASPVLQSAARGSRAWPVLPTQLYSSFTGLLLVALLIAYFSLPPITGRVFALMLILEGLSRFVLEMLRVEPVVWPHPGAPTGFSISMILALVSILAGAIMWFILGRLFPPAITPPDAPADYRPV